jgi:hypothetical protein
MRAFVLSLVCAAAAPVAAFAAAPNVKISAVECFYVNDNVVYTMKEPGRYEAGKFRCHATTTARGEDGQVALVLELRQQGKGVAKASDKGHTRGSVPVKFELELKAPEDYDACSDFELVMTVGNAARPFKVRADCPD